MRYFNQTLTLGYRSSSSHSMQRIWPTSIYYSGCRRCRILLLNMEVGVSNYYSDDGSEIIYLLKKGFRRNPITDLCSTLAPISEDVPPLLKSITRRYSFFKNNLYYKI